MANCGIYQLCDSPDVCLQPQVAPHQYSCLDPQLVPCPCLAALHSLDPVQILVWNKPCLRTILLVVTCDLSDLATVCCDNNAAEWKCRAMQASKCDLLYPSVACTVTAMQQSEHAEDVHELEQ